MAFYVHSNEFVEHIDVRIVKWNDGIGLLAQIFNNWI